MKTNNIVPKLRFPEFSGEWEIKELGEILEIGNGRDYKHLTKGNIPVFGTGGIITFVNQELYNGESVFIGRKGTIDKPFYYNGKFWTVDTLFYTHNFKNCNVKFIFYLFQNIKWNLYNEATGVPSLTKVTILKIKQLLPTQQEQQKIADCLASLDELLDLEEKKLSALQKYKKGLLQKLFPQGESLVPEWRFPEFQNSGEWKEKKLKDVLCYEQPTNYIVEDISSQKIGVPVLTANKSFILGYTNEKNRIYDKVPVIIFDDFTTDKKYVTFSFKIKSSAIKILKSVGNNNLKFIFELLQLKNFSANEHKRYYISVYQFLKILIPTIQEQQKIADFLSGVDELIEKQQQKIELLKQHKKGLLQGLFPNMQLG